MAATKTLPLDFDLVIYGGTTFKRQFVWKPDGITPLDFTGYSAVMNIGSPGQPAIIGLSTDSGELTLSSVGEINIRIDQAETVDLAPGVLYYNLDITDLAGDPKRFLRGRVSVIQDVKDETP